MTKEESRNREELVFWRWMLLFAIAISMVTAFGILKQPLIEDEVEFAEIAQSYVKIGQPLAHVHGKLESVVHHPQLYHLALSGASLIGGAEWGGRSFGLLCLLVSAWLGALLARAVWQLPNVGEATAIMIILCPMCLRGSLLLDIDNTLLPVLCLGFLLVLANSDESVKTNKLWEISGLFALALWCKLTTPVLMIIPLWILWKEKRGHIYIIVIAGIILFSISWLGFCWWKGLEVLGPLKHLIGKGGSGMGLTTTNWYIELGKRLVQYLLWLSPFMMGLLLVPKERASNQRLFHALMVFVIVGFLFYWIIGGSAFGFPRYQVPIVMVGLVLLAPLVVKGWEMLGSKQGMRVLVIIGGTLFLSLVSGDILYPFYTYPEKAALGNLRLWRLAVQLLCIIGSITCFSATFFLLWKSRTIGWWRKIGVLSSIILLPWWIGQNVVMSQANYNTAYLYGERGIREVSSMLNRVLPDDAEIIASKDVAYYTNYRFPHQVLGAICSAGNLEKELLRPEVRVLVYRDSQWIDSVTGPCLRSSSVQQILNSLFKYHHIGNFRIWMKLANSYAYIGKIP
jgi:hypothetical protein